MKKVLYISNIEVPYRAEYLNQLSKKVELTVLYERKKSSNRDTEWTSRVKSKYNTIFLNGINFKNEYTISIGILKYVFSKKYEKIIIGCFNSPSEILAMLLMRLFHKKYILNLDGEYFLLGSGIKKMIKRFLVKGAEFYLIAGEKAANNLSKIVPKEKVHPYYFSSLTKRELVENSKHINNNINDKVLVVGQYFDYKGLDIALDVAKLDQNIKYRFIGSGKRSRLLEDKVHKMKLTNVEVIPFLKKEELYHEYQKCKCLLSTSRKECWGLIINEAASFGCPIISTQGCEAAVELVDKKWIENSLDSRAIYQKLLELGNNNYDKEFLISNSMKYSIEKSVDETVKYIYER